MYASVISVLTLETKYVIIIKELRTGYYPVKEKEQKIVVK